MCVFTCVTLYVVSVSSMQLVQSVQRSSNIIESLLSEMLPKTRNFMTRRSLTVEILPLVVETLAPTLRPVSL